MDATHILELPDILELQDQLDKAERDAHLLIADLADELGVWQPEDHSWSVAQCLDHLARSNRMYLQPMQTAGNRAREKARFRQRPAVPGPLGRWFAGTMEPPAKAPFRMKAPRSILPNQTPSLQGASEDFRTSQDQVRAFLVDYSDLDLASIRFANPFVPGIRFSLATGLHVLIAHERRHLWQAWRVRRAAEDARG